ncbi:MAG: hypothetical protein ABIJ59_04215 [Pseudomonadota bacterium]
MTGATEILVLVLLILAILILPRLFNPAPKNKKELLPKRLSQLRPITRAGIIMTLVYPAGMALYLKPWESHLIIFLSLGVLPVFLSWSLVWILSGKKK